MRLGDVLSRILTVVGIEADINEVSDIQVRTDDLADDRFYEAKSTLSKIAFYNEGVVKSTPKEFVVETREYINDEWVRVRTSFEHTNYDKTRISSKIFAYETLTFGGVVVLCRDKKIKELVGQ